MNKIAICITTFLRDSLLSDTIKNTLSFISDNCIILIGDQNWSLEKYNYFSNLDSKIFYYQLPFDAGLGYTRNFLVSKAKELNCNYCLITADNIQFIEKYDFSPFIDFLEKKSERGIVGFELLNSKCPWEFLITLTPDGIKFDSSKKFITENGITLKCVDICRNIFLGKTNTLLNLWDNKMKLGEHELSFIEYKKRGYKVFWTDIIVFKKIIGKNTPQFNTGRSRFLKYIEILRKKLNISNWVVYSQEVKKEIALYKSKNNIKIKNE